MAKEQKTAIQPMIIQKGEDKPLNLLGDIITIEIKYFLLERRIKSYSFSLVLLNDLMVSHGLFSLDTAFSPLTRSRFLFLLYPFVALLLLLLFLLVILGLLL